MTSATPADVYTLSLVGRWLESATAMLAMPGSPAAVDTWTAVALPKSCCLVKVGKTLENHSMSCRIHTMNCQYDACGAKRLPTKRMRNLSRSKPRLESRRRRAASDVIIALVLRR